MNCPAQNMKSTEMLIDYCAGALPLGTAAELERHIASCAECKAFVQAQQQIWSALEDWEAGPVSADFDRRLYARIAETERLSWTQWAASKFAWRPALSVAGASAALAVALFVSSPANGPLTFAPSAPPVHVEPSRAESLEPEQLERALEDLEMLKQLSPAASTSL